MKIYNSLEEKKQYFIKGNLKIDKLEDLIRFINLTFKTDPKVEVFYRGQPEAKYMLYNSLQRLWITKKLNEFYTDYPTLIKNLIQNSKDWNGGLVEKYLKYAQSDHNEISYLSIMQHYGVPTPLLDFTTDIKKSLYFATENIDISPSNIEIEKYFSIYYISKSNTVLHMSDYILNRMVEESKAFETPRKKDLKSALQFDMLLIENSDIEFRIQNNLNIINQDGAFIFNSSPLEPLELHYIKNRKLFLQIAEKHQTELDFTKEIGGCININKKLVEPIREYLKGEGIHRDTIYPDLNQLKFDCLNKEWKNICA